MSIFIIPGFYVEQRTRRNELAMSFFPRVLESFKLFLVKRKLCPEIPGFIFILSAIAWAVISEAHANKSYPMKENFRRVLDFLIGSDEEYQMHLVNDKKAESLSDEIICQSKGDC
jgi:hypothetical protein